MQLRIISKLGSETLHNNGNLVVYTIRTIYGNSYIYIISTIDDKSYIYTIRTSDGNLYNTSEKKSFIYKKIKTISSHHQIKFFHQNIFSITNNFISTFFFLYF